MEEDQDLIEECSSSEDEVIVDEADTNFGCQEIVEEHKLKKFPHNCIVSIDLNRNNNFWQHLGTGFLIAPNLVATCAHVVVNKAERCIIKNLVVNFNLGGLVQDAHTIRVVNAKVHHQFLKFQGKAVYDYALLKLEKPIQLPRYFRFVTDFDSERQNLKLFGYPSFDKVGGQKFGWQKGSEGKEDTSIFSISVYFKKIKHFLPSSSGYSGGPILNKNNDVVGIHKGAVVDKSTVSSNWGPLINFLMLQNMRKWEAHFNPENSFKAINYLSEKSLGISQHLINISKSKTQEKLVELDILKQKKMHTCCVGQIVTEYKGVQAKGNNTAFLISQNLVLTNLTSVYCYLFDHFQPSSQKIKITFFLCSRGKQESYEIQHFCFNKELIELKLLAKKEGNLAKRLLQDVSLDYCLLKLKKSIKQQQYLQLVANFNEQKEPYSIFGPCKNYDSKQPQKAIKMEGLLKSTEPMNIFLDQKLIFYKVNSNSGQSGSPIIIRQNKVIGLHKFNHKLANNCKGARLVTVDMIERLLDWSKQMEASPFKCSYFKEGALIEVANKEMLFVEIAKHKREIYDSRVQ